MKLEIGLPLKVMESTPMNLYVWDSTDTCCYEPLGAIQHETLQGLKIQDLSDLDSEIQPNYELAKSGQGSSWLGSSNGVISMNGFLPVSSKGFITGFAMLLHPQLNAQFQNLGFLTNSDQ